ncbi:N-acetylglutamate synthase, GNAT family [Sporobacter termitidis DSM 10068]|uniref:N-acetylglutamate synthase, GNAT family n=1 Tax=Sporobacter termitidis DSM 10068 TaxID=1123282 RepID=A0A1M5WY63_9FIRM|nr:GNAT family N-acetyltransferase [Sporobacter termitidis]SHH92451.1 N-acetylglutamate synthase, GNAT family [Sporobacter termitidis DSM 10068]
MYKYVRSSLYDNREFFDLYIGSLSSRYDDFLENHILDSEIFSITADERRIGYFGVYKDKTLTQFVLSPSDLRHAQPVFREVLETYRIENALVPTCDELFLSLCLDRHKKVSLQAYLFEDGRKRVRPPEYGRELLRQATPGDMPAIIAICGDFLDRYEERIKNGQLYVMRKDGEFLGLGVIVDNVIIPNCKGTGMFINAKYRGKGVGRSILLHLKAICNEKGISPVPGCTYQSDDSRRALESAGYVTKTRLLNIEFDLAEV